MSRNSLIYCLVALVVLMAGTAAAVAFLYSGTSSQGQKTEVPEDGRYVLLSAIPSDAALVGYFSHASRAPFIDFDEYGFPMAVSLHYSGSLETLYVFDAGKASGTPSDKAAGLIEHAERMGLSVEYIDGSSVADSRMELSERSLILAGTSSNVLKSARRHIGKGVSILDASGFSSVLDRVHGGDALFVSNAHASELMPSLTRWKPASCSTFMTRLSDWMAFDIGRLDDKGVALVGSSLHASDLSDFMSVLKNVDPSVPAVSGIVPSYAMTVLSLPMKNTSGYVDAYRLHADSRQTLQKVLARCKALGAAAGVDPLEFVQRMDVREVATASFVCGSSLERVNIMKVGKPDVQLIFKGTEVQSLDGYKPEVHPYLYTAFSASLFGDVFSLKDETCFTYIDGYIISGSRTAVEEYVSGRALEYTLKEYLSDAGLDDLSYGGPCPFVAYMSFTADRRMIESLVPETFMDLTSTLRKDGDFVPVIVRASKVRKGLTLSLTLDNIKLQKIRSSEHERDTLVAVPEGPFRVKNSGTGRMNLFYQQDNMYLCLKEEDGKGLWGVPFSHRICGSAQTVDYFANGKLQILFGAGKELYLIDRLGRFVSGFPVGLEKEILVGPDVYDFSGSRKYNVMVLHKDNTIEMYNLKGVRPTSWKGITAREKIKGLPQRIDLGSSTFWVVRTSLQTLIFPFEGGQPLTVYEGDKRIRPDSEVKVMDSANVQVMCYDGKQRTVRLK